MPIAKNITIQVRDNTWTGGRTVPRALTAAAVANPYRANVLASLVFLALHTRPPVNYGFSLADCWAWQRYAPALAATPELRLRREWNQLDPHQKTVLSGDFGVGFTTWFLHQMLGFEWYADTLWVVNTLLPRHFELGRSTKLGPRKSPDYIVMDQAGNFSVLECKGTQTSLIALHKAMNRGGEQKGNLRAIGSTHIQHSLVAGLFIPQYTSSDQPILSVADPDWVDVERELAKFSGDQLQRGVAQIASSKELALMGLPHTAAALARAKENADAVSVAFERDSESLPDTHSLVSEELRLVREHRWPAATPISDDVSIVGVKLEARLPEQTLANLRTSAAPAEYAERAKDTTQNAGWKMTDDDTSVDLTSPLGSVFRLSLMEA